MLSKDPVVSILFFDDDPNYRTLLERRLARKGFKITAVSSHQECIRAFDRDRPDVVLLDYRLPDVDGIEVFRSLSKIDIDLVAILLTGLSDHKVAVEALTSGMSNFLVKDVSLTFIDLLPQIISESLQRKQIVRQNREYTSELKIAYEEAQKASQAKTNFIAGMSHEFKTPLNAIIAFSDCLISGIYGEVNEKQSKILDKIVTAGMHLNSLTESVLTAAQLDNQRAEIEINEFNLIETLRFCLSVQGPIAAKSKVSLEAIVEEEELSIKGNQKYISQVLINLISNGIKFSNGGDVRVLVKTTATQVLIEVCDNGIGMKPETLERIFNPFEQADDSISRRFGGTGLGLSLTKRFIELHNGSIDVKSVFGEGTTFSVNLPIES